MAGACEYLEAAAQMTGGDHHLPGQHYRRLMDEIGRAWLFLGDTSRAEVFLQQSGPLAGGERAALPASDMIDLQGAAQATRLRLLLMQRQVDHALALSSALLAQAQSEGRLALMIEILILRALALSEKKAVPQALEALEQALTLAQPEGYARLFLDEGAWLAKLILQASARGLDGGYAARLLPTFQVEPGAPTHPAQALIDPLTEREIEVLKLIENGCSNQQIAARLFISLPTVKRHISNIYAKLGAASRTQALALARELSLF
jgi:LuxR family maltose regulon positive regulatory protein